MSAPVPVRRCQIFRGPRSRIAVKGKCEGLRMGRTKRWRKRFRAGNFENGDVIDLLKWMRVRISHLQVRNFPGVGRGFRCKRKIRVGDELISIPLELMITPKVSSDVLSVINTQELPPQLILSIFLMYERHLSDKSRYWNYIKLLPEEYTTAFFCTETEMKLLPQFMSEEICNRKQEVETHYNTILCMYESQSCQHCSRTLNRIFEYNLFVWAWFTVNTRSVYYKDDEKDSLALAPLLDIFNHSSDADTHISIDKEKNTYSIITNKEFKKHTQIFIKYGSHSNWKLLSEYGFILNDNPNDVVEFALNEVISAVKETKENNAAFWKDSSSKSKYNLIKRHKLNENLSKSLEEFSWNYKALLYVLLTDDSNLSILQSKIYGCEFSDKEISLIHEVSVRLLEYKRQEFEHDLLRMESLKISTESFTLAKQLVKMYLMILDGKLGLS